MRIMDKTAQALLTSLNLRQRRQDLITSNIANAETPGYRAKRLDFEAALANAIDLDKINSIHVNDPDHIAVGGGGVRSLQPEIYDDPSGDITNDGNTVDRDKEMAKMAENRVLYDAQIQLINKKLGMWKSILSSER